MEAKLLLALTHAALEANIHRASYSVIPEAGNRFRVTPHTTHDGDNALRVSPAGQIFCGAKLMGNIKDFRQGCKHHV